MIEIQLQRAGIEDLDHLVEMNLQLIEDEAYDVPITQKELEERMQGFLGDGFQVFLFKEVQGGDRAVGYCVVNTARSPAYLRHFFIRRGFRRKGVGRAAIEALCGNLNCSELDVEVMAWNEVGKTFWRSLGFQHRYEGLRWTKDGS